MNPLVRELAEDGVPVTVTCRVLKIARQPSYYRWLTNPATDAEVDQAYRANALFDAHRDDPEFGYRFLVDEARDAGVVMSERTVWRICSDSGWWSAFGKKRGKNRKKPGPPVHDYLCAVCRVPLPPIPLHLGVAQQDPAGPRLLRPPRHLRLLRRPAGGRTDGRRRC
jgi:hypothetical protein